MAVALTTTDNPYDPFKNFAEWNAFDMQKGYNTAAYLARVANVSPELSPRDYEDAIEQAIDEIVSFNALGIYKKVYDEP